MKTTNFEISKKLKEIGFKPKNEESQVWNYDGQIRWKYPAYEFETLFDALPTHIPTIKNGFYQRFLFIQTNPLIIGYYEPNYEYMDHYNMGESIFESSREENESLADTAGRLLIKLYEAGINNFNK